MKNNRLKGLFINCIEAQDSIFASGKMAYDCLVGSDKYSLDYVEISKENLTLGGEYDFYFFNYHFATMPWLETRSLKRVLPGVVITMVLEVSPNDPFVFCSPDDFDIYCVLDPTLHSEAENVFAFPRPLEKFGADPRYEPREIPLIGSFGLGTHGKGFEHVVDAVNREFDEAEVRINIPFAVYSDKDGSYAKHLAQICKRRSKDGIAVTVTHDYMTKQELIDWCGENTINCFFYDRNVPGLAATTDQAIASGRPLLVSKNNTFRHIQKFIKPFPYQTIREAIEKTETSVAQIQHEWSPKKFRERFEYVLEKCRVEKKQTSHVEDVSLPVKPRTFSDIVQLVRDKAAVMTRLKKLDKTLGVAKKFARKHKLPKSHSQFGEDVVVYELLRKMSIQNMSYLDIGANDPEFFSNTYVFYKKGFTGVLVEPNPSLCGKLRAGRPRDKVLNVGIGIDEERTEADFYQFASEFSGLGTFSHANAKYVDEIGLFGAPRKIQQIIKVELLSINYVISTYFAQCPDFISIDVEGWDLKILESLNFELYNPAVFCVETLAYADDGSTYRIEAISEFLKTKGYFQFHETEANAIFVNKNLYDFHEFKNASRLEHSESH